MEKTARHNKFFSFFLQKDLQRYNIFSRYAEILLYFFSILNVYLIMLKMLHPYSAIYKTRILYFINIGQYMTILESK